MWPPVVIHSQAVASDQEVDERQLIAASLAGDEDAFRQLVERHYRVVLNVAYRALGTLAAAEDCTQDVFIKVHQKLQSYRADTPFIHWLHRVAANTVTDAMRRRRTDLSLEALRQAPADWSDPAAAAALREQRMAVRRAMADLPGRLRDAIALQVFHELSYREIALVLNIPIGTVMSRIHNAKRLLRRQLADYISEPRIPVEANKS